MKALVYKGKNDFSLEERPVPVVIEPTDAIIKVTLASICASDLHIKEGSIPRAIPGVIVGHEMVGIVESVGMDVKKVSPGDRVTVNVETFCNSCFFCERGYVNNCTDSNGGWALGCRIDGGQAEYVRVPYADNGLNIIPDSVSDEQALFTGDILSTGYWAADIGDIKEGDVVAILGAGPTGLCAAICTRLHKPSKIVLIDISDERLELARKNGIADVYVNPLNEDLSKVIKNLTNGRGADVVMEIAGGKDTFQTAWQIVRPNATVCVIALYNEPQTLPLPDMYGKNLTFKTGGVDASNCEKILKLIEKGEIDTTCLITHRFSLNEILKAYDIFENRLDGVMKVAIKP